MSTLAEFRREFPTTAVLSRAILQRVKTFVPYLQTSTPTVAISAEPHQWRSTALYVSGADETPESSILYVMALQKSFLPY